MFLAQAMATSASGLTAERLRMDLIAHNIANASTTRTDAGGPFRRRVAVVEAREQPGFQDLLSGRLAIAPAATAGALGAGVRVLAIREDPRPPRLTYDPSHPDADADGYVALPNVDVITEMVDLIAATRAYEAGVSALTAARNMALRALEIGR